MGPSENLKDDLDRLQQFLVIKVKDNGQIYQDYSNEYYAEKVPFRFGYSHVSHVSAASDYAIRYQT